MLLHRIEVHRIRFGTKTGGVQVIFDLHYGFPCLDKRHKRIALGVLEALLIQRPIVVGEQSGYLADIVL